MPVLQLQESQVPLFFLTSSLHLLVKPLPLLHRSAKGGAQCPVQAAVLHQDAVVAQLSHMWEESGDGSEHIPGALPL
eukprot:108293-Prorocentrum_lima.AAC.1